MPYTQDNINEFREATLNKYPENKKFFDKIKAKKVKNLDDPFHQLHDEVFEEVDCLACANCCKTTSPVFTDTDIERIAKHLKMRPVQLIEKYLHLDEDKDYVLNSSPCTFLGADNYCSIYEIRPKACREYPHTDRKNMAGIMKLTLANTKVCPAVFEIVERLKKTKIIG
ncbi:YkgJ family cysteine cluster protein [Flectobacillus major]|jgi:Fe-S-cluster containining protein|uniref:YkgJ family cysteine cluster protein n=1 Tax=Flectobacillus major TaxID=103 RepID=UPI0003FE28C3|nr:YkgJ family cysteine cluster protein [Flectobacillus major]